MRRTASSTPAAPIAGSGPTSPRARSRASGTCSPRSDEFVVAHFLGWLGKSLIFRHAGVAWFNSIVFEFVEMSFEHWMPNFAECWWDHWIMDVLTANLGGIILGHMVMHYFSVKQYRWMNVSEIPDVKGKVVSNPSTLLSYCYIGLFY